MNEIQIFENKQFGSVRVVEIDGEPWFVGKDVAEKLGYKNASKALLDHVDPEDKLNNESLSSLGQRGGWLINESGLYSLVLSSKLPEAKAFKRWVTGEILPSIRKYGGYIAGQEEMSDIELLSRALLIAQSQIEDRDRKLKEAAPKVAFVDSVADSDTLILVYDMAKILKQNGFEIGGRRLFEVLKQNNLIMKRGKYNLPTQKGMDEGIFRIVEYPHAKWDGSYELVPTTKINVKGQQYILNKFLSKEFMI